MSDGEGIYRLTALPVGNYDVTAELSGLQQAFETARASSSTSAQTLDLNVELKVAGVSEIGQRHRPKRR